MNEAFQTVREALEWHEHGSQDERRAKALPALDTIKAELDRLEEANETRRERCIDLAIELDKLRAQEANFRDLVAVLEEDLASLKREQDNAGFIPWRAAQDALDELAYERDKLREERDEAWEELSQALARGRKLSAKAEKYRDGIAELEGALRELASEQQSS